MIRRFHDWLIRRDTDAISSRYAGWLSRLEVPVAAVVGVQQSSIEKAALTIMGFWIARAIIGYIDLHGTGATAHANDYASRLAPSNVKILKRGDKDDGRKNRGRN
jgi:hypothetical protein